MTSPIRDPSPLVLSSALSQLMGGHDDVTSCEVYLKMEAFLPTGSFKIRGVWNRAQQAVKEGTKHLVGCSTGNAGLALSLSAKILKVPCTIFVAETIEPKIVNRLQQDGATVVVGGKFYFNAEDLALKFSEQPGYTYVTSDTHPCIWSGNSTLVKELVSQLPNKPGAVILAVGGGGLLCGVLEGLKEVGWADVPLIGMETIGADCFNLSVKSKKIVYMDAITSIALSIGNRNVTPQVMELLPNYDVISEVVTDAQAVKSCLQFIDDERVMVEPACGAALAAVYTGLLRRLVAEGRIKTISRDRPVVVVVCGGKVVSLERLQEWAKMLDVPFPSPTTQ